MNCLLRIFELSSDMIFICSAEGKIELINPSATDGLGYQSNDVAGIYFSHLLYQEDQLHVEKSIDQLTREVFPTELRIRHQSGHYHWISCQMHPNPSDGKNIVIAQDITKCKEAQQKIEESKSIKKLNQELTYFNHLLSHDIKEPLRNIVSFSNLALKEIPSNSKLQEYFQYIISSGKQLHLLINNLVIYNNISQDQLLKLRNIDMGQVMDRLQANLDSMIQKRNGQLIYGNLPQVFGNENLIFLVFKHLFENGFLYNDSHEPVVEIKYYCAPHSHEFVITDNGIGIEAEYHSYVFDLFKRLHSRQQYSGTGVGLAIVKKVLEKMDGEIKIIQSVPGQGTSIKVSFPMLNKSAENNVLIDPMYA